jgi:predicted alpha/beta-fold hydrolase
MRDIQTNEIEWYLRDHFFRQFNQGKQHFKMESLGGEMISLYLRYRNYNLQDMNNITAAVENLISLRVIKKTDNNALELTSRFSRLQCSKCFYISYLNSNEPRNCLRCLSSELHDFPSKK